jgi:hypothetical protein
MKSKDTEQPQALLCYLPTEMHLLLLPAAVPAPVLSMHC